ncbi:ABC transporter permease [Roseivirga sp. BDSF3-8]|uniref:ABC transporter permease n=1 Tax=Roseivirga sp. BDSF3-8 TaxID=3241598 RepID=UPI0035321666
MNKILLVTAREYLTRVRKKSFLIITIATPIALVLIFGLFGYLAVNSADTKVIQVIDESGRFTKTFKESDRVHYLYISNTLDDAKKNLEESDADGILYIPAIDIDKPEGIKYYTSGSPSMSTIRSIERNIEQVIEDVKLQQSGLDAELIRDLKPNVSLETFPLDEEKESNAAAAFGTGYALSLFTYFFIFLYGAQIMRGVMEEKTNRIVEVIISSVKPLQLLYGKILGVAAVGLTQFIIWIVLIVGLSSAGAALLGGQVSDEQKQQFEEVQAARPGGASGSAESLVELQSAIDSIDFTSLVGVFLFYFLGGYLLYGALFAAVGSAVDSDTDSQQFMLPITIPLILSVFALAFVLDDPDGTLAFWLSVFPFTSPVIMMARQPFGVPPWEMVLSMVMLIGGFVFTTWVASRIYRVGILMHGTKVNYKVLAKWFMQKQ